MSAATYPVRVDASLDHPLSRWLWLVKWILALPHYVVLALLWPAFAVLSVCAFFAILFTGRYPRSIFTFNVGVLRWTWRVQYYAYGALGTDRYPPFTLADVPDFPAHLDVSYPERLSRGLVLVKWWLLALPHYLVAGLFAGAVWIYDTDGRDWGGAGLIGLMVVVAAVVLAFTGRYPRSVYDFVLGMNRWVLRVAAYAALMTDEYPPFRLDMGPRDPGGTLTLPRPRPGADRTPATWTGGRIVAVVAGVFLGLAAGGLVTGGIALARLDHGRDAAGYVTTPAQVLTTDGYALVSGQLDLHGSATARTLRSLLGDVRIEIASGRGGVPVFAGVAPAPAADRYLEGVARTVLHDVAGPAAVRTEHAGRPPAVPPAVAGIWTAQVSGTGVRTLTLPVTEGSWKVVVMNADGTAAVQATARASARLPRLGAAAVASLAAGGAVFAAAVVLVAVPVVRASAART